MTDNVKRVDFGTSYKILEEVEKTFLLLLKNMMERSR